jgi:hypothetical protein
MRFSTIGRLFAAAFLASFILFASNSFLAAQDYDVLDESGGAGRNYIVEMSGKVLNEEFSGAMASVRILPPNPGSAHPTMVIIRGFPKANSRNCFYWHSDGSEMIASPEEIVCDIKRSYLRPPKLDYQCHFFYLSPILIKPIKGMFLTQREKERQDTAIKRALPTLVYAQAGQLKVRLYSNMIYGSIWMKGYDLIERSYVQYNAFFSGMAATRLDPKWQIKEPQRNSGVFWTQPLKFK